MTLRARTFEYRCTRLNAGDPMCKTMARFLKYRDRLDGKYEINR
jgi:hypothetical protein